MKPAAYQPDSDEARAYGVRRRCPPPGPRCGLRLPARYQRALWAERAFRVRRAIRLKPCGHQATRDRDSESGRLDNIMIGRAVGTVGMLARLTLYGPAPVPGSDASACTPRWLRVGLVC
jgi:hypothetical protein